MPRIQKFCAQCGSPNTFDNDKKIYRVYKGQYGEGYSQTFVEDIVATSYSEATQIAKTKGYSIDIFVDKWEHYTMYEREKSEILKEIQSLKNQIDNIENLKTELHRLETLKNKI